MARKKTRIVSEVLNWLVSKPKQSCRSMKYAQSRIRLDDSEKHAELDLGGRIHKPERTEIHSGRNVLC